MLVPDLSIWRISEAAAATFPPLDWQPLTWRLYLKTFWKFYQETFVWKFFAESFIWTSSHSPDHLHPWTVAAGEPEQEEA